MAGKASWMPPRVGETEGEASSHSLGQGGGREAMVQREEGEQGATWLLKVVGMVIG